MEPKFAKIKDDEDLIRDRTTNAVLNTNNNALEQYKAKRDKDKQMSQDIENLKSQMSNIEHMLRQLVNRD